MYNFTPIVKFTVPIHWAKSVPFPHIHIMWAKTVIALKEKNLT